MQGSTVKLTLKVDPACFGADRDTLSVHFGGLIYIVRPGQDQRVSVAPTDVFPVKLFRYENQQDPIWQLPARSFTRDTTVTADCR